MRAALSGVTGKLLLCVFINGPARATGPTSVDAACWLKTGTNLTLNADDVTVWGDESGNGNDVTDASPLFGAPRVNRGALNGEDIVGFGSGLGSSNSDGLSWGGAPLSGAGTGFMVVQPVQPGDVWRMGTSGLPIPWSPPEIWDDFGASTRTQLMYQSVSAEGRRDWDCNFERWFLYAVAITSDGVMTGYVDGIERGQQGGFTSSWATSPRVGDNNSKFYVAELVLYDRVLNANELNDLVAYAGEKFALKVAPPVFSPDGGVHDAAQSVMITCGHVGATIRYTEDGSDPSETSGTVIASGSTINISSDTVLKAIATKAGLPDSEIQLAVFTIEPAGLPASGLVSWARSGLGLKYTATPNHVDEWLDASNNDNDFACGSWAGHPIAKHNELNGQTVLGFGFNQGSTFSDLTVGFHEVPIGDFNAVADNRTTVCNIAELLLYDRVLSDGERDAVVVYLGNRFGIPVTIIPSGGNQAPGDCNQDGAFDLSDAVCLLDFIFQSTPPVLPCNSTPANVALMDCNGDGAIDISDAIYKLNFLFQGGPPPEQGTGCIEIPDCPSNPGCR